jgi:hypothetical protein
MRSRVLRIAVVALAMTGPAAAGAGGEADAGRVFKAGAAASNITPPLDGPIAGGWNSPPATWRSVRFPLRCSSKLGWS